MPKFAAAMKFRIEWQDKWGKWQRYQEKTNEADAFRVAKRRAAEKQLRHRIINTEGQLLDLLDP